MLPPEVLAVVKPLLQRSLDIMSTASCWEEKAAKKCHIVGLQGEKRRLRYLYREAANIETWLEHFEFDLIKIDTCAKSGAVDVSNLTDCQTTMKGIIAKLWVIYFETHKIANELVSANFRDFAMPLYGYVSKLFNILGELQRADVEYERGSYDYHHVSRYQVSYYNVHDEYEKKEEDQGYKDYND